MAELNTKRKFQERFLDGFDRSQLRQEIQKVKPTLRKKMKNKYATWALGASLALGGIAAPVKMIHESQTPEAGRADLNSSIANDLRAATGIAHQVAGGVVAGVESAAQSSLQAVGEAPKQLAVITEEAKEQFFKTQVPFGSLIYREALKNDLRPEFVAAIVQAESQFKPNARSPVGARGLMQLMPKTGKWMGARDLNNPTQNVQAGTKYLKYLNERFDGNETKIIAAYNAGEGNVRRFGGIPPFKETRNYVKKVRNNEADFKQRVDSHIADVTASVGVVR